MHHLQISLFFITFAVVIIVNPSPIDKMEKQEDPQVTYKSLMKARNEGLLVQNEREYREERFHVIQNHIRRGQEMFDAFYGDFVNQNQRNEYYAVIDRERRRSEDEKQAFYPKTVRAKMQVVRQLIGELRETGVNEEAILELLRPERPVSRLVITSDYHILLPEFGNREVRMSPLPKTVFLLFLRHPEGIVLKEIGDYFIELMEIYKAIVGPRFKEAKARMSLSRICDPLDNSLNEKISRIHEALRNLLDESAAMNYFICGKRSEARQILLPQTLVEWER